MAFLLLLTGLTISAVAIYYSVVGLAAIFSAAVIPIVIMGAALEVAKLVCATWLKANWSRAPRLMKYYMTTAVIVLMLITSMGIFGFLSKAHNDQTLVSGDVQSKIAIYDEKIKTARENIEADRKQLKQMDEAVDQIMGRSTDEKGADKANAVRKSQLRDRSALAKDIEANQKLIASLNDEAAPIRAEVRKVEAEVGPLKYIAKFIYGESGADENMLEKAVTWVIILIVIVFDPLAVIMLLASQMTFAWRNNGHDPLAEEEKIPEDDGFRFLAGDEEPVAEAEQQEVDVAGNPTYRGHSIKDAMRRIDEEIEVAEANKLLEEIEPEVTEPEVIEELPQPVLSAPIDVDHEDADNDVIVVESIPVKDELDVPVLENEEMWAQRVIDEDEYTEDDYDNSNVTITHTPDGIVVEDRAGTQEIPVDHDEPALERPGDYITPPTYVQNEEQQESNTWTKLANHTLTEEEYLKKLQNKKGTE